MSEDDQSPPDESFDAYESDVEFEQCLNQAWNAYAQEELEAVTSWGNQALTHRPQNGRAWFVLACGHERHGNYRKADHCFLQAQRADEAPQPSPWRTTWRHFYHAVEWAAESLPAELQLRLEEVEIALANYPSPDICTSSDNPDCMGWASGPTVNQRQQQPSEEPSRIHLFRRPHEHSTSNRKEFDQEIRRTLFHELGRYLELDSGDMDRLGLLE